MHKPSMEGSLQLPRRRGTKPAYIPAISMSAPDVKAVLQNTSLAQAVQLTSCDVHPSRNGINLLHVTLQEGHPSHRCACSRASSWLSMDTNGVLH